MRNTQEIPGLVGKVVGKERAPFSNGVAPGDATCKDLGLRGGTRMHLLFSNPNEELNNKVGFSEERRDCFYDGMMSFLEGSPLFLELTNEYQPWEELPAG